MNTLAIEPFVWTDSLLLGHGPIDEEHEEFANLICDMQRAEDDGLHAALNVLLEHAVEHFAAEDTLMAATAFAARECHAKEHEAVLSTMRGVQKRLDRGDCEVARTLATELAAWFPAHVQHLDSALSHWLCKRQYGGKPIVLRRRRAAENTAA
jgi:hemerythrin-like metal-binding protein